MIVWGGVPGTATGGGYCACPAGRLFYRDADGDGFGDPASLPIKLRWRGPCECVVIDYTDCNDAVGSAHPGASEVGNGIDDDCDGLVDERVRCGSEAAAFALESRSCARPSPPGRWDQRSP